MTTRPPHTFYVVAAFARVDSNGVALMPGQTVHAATLGSEHTLCGIPTFSWRKFLTTSFFKVRIGHCRTCHSHASAAVRAARSA